VRVRRGLIGAARFEADTDALFWSAFFLVRDVAQHPFVRVSEGWLDDAVGPEAAGAHDVEFGGIATELGDEVQPADQAGDKTRTGRTPPDMCRCSSALRYRRAAVLRRAMAEGRPKNRCSGDRAESTPRPPARPERW
jgi:hypothetical protein